MTRSTGNTARNVGGTLDWRVLAGDRDLHRPSNPALVAAEVRRLAATGLKANDISIALRLHPTDVHAALAARDATP